MQCAATVQVRVEQIKPAAASAGVGLLACWSVGRLLVLSYSNATPPAAPAPEDDCLFLAGGATTFFFFGTTGVALFCLGAGAFAAPGGAAAAGFERSKGFVGGLLGLLGVAVDVDGAKGFGTRGLSPPEGLAEAKVGVGDGDGLFLGGTCSSCGTLTAR